MSIYDNKIQPFTVAMMREAIKGLDDDIQIIIGGDDNCTFEWANLEVNYDSPNEDDSYSLTFYVKDDFDSRQF